jgi:proline dehydrogenase
LETGSVRVSNRGILGAFEKAVSNRGWDSHVGKKGSHFQNFALEILLLTANAAKPKELRERNRPFGVAGVGRGQWKIAMGVSRLVERRSN